MNKQYRVDFLDKSNEIFASYEVEAETRLGAMAKAETRFKFGHGDQESYCVKIAEVA